MEEIRFNIVGNSDGVIREVEEIRKALIELGKTVDKRENKNSSTVSSFSIIAKGLSGLADEFERAEGKNEKFKKTGKNAIPVWKQVTSSLFSWHTALNLGANLLTLFGTKIAKWVNEVINGKTAIDQLKIAYDNLKSAQLEGIKNAQSELTHLKLIYQATQDDTLSRKERMAAVKELQNRYPNYFSDLSLEMILTGKAADKYKILANSILDAARAKAYEAKIVENETKILDLEQERIGALTKKVLAEQESTRLKASRNATTSAQAFVPTPIIGSKEQGKSVSDVQKYADEAEFAKSKIDALRTANKQLVEQINPSNLLYDTNYNEDMPSNVYSEQRLKELQIKNAKDYAHQLEDLYYDAEQAKVDGMAEGSKKTLAQIELNHEKELIAIDREKEDFLQRKKDNAKAEFVAKEEIKVTQNSKYIKKEFDTSSIILSDDEIQMFDNKYIAALNRQANEKQAYYDVEKQGMNEHLKEYGTYQEKRKAITELYDDKIAKAATEGERETLEAQRGQALSVLDVDANKKTAAFSKLFADMKDRTVEDMINIAAEAQAALDYVNAGKFKTDSKGNGLYGISQETFDLLRKSPEELEKVKQGIKDTKAEAANFDNAFTKMAGGFKTLFEEGADPKKFQEGLAQIEGAMNEVMGAGKLLSNSLSSLGDAFGSDALKGIAEGMNAAMDAASATMDGAKMGFAVGGPFGAAAGAAIGLATSLASSIAKIHDAKNEKRIKRLQEQIDTLNRSYDKLGDSVEKAYSSDASQLIEQQNRLLEQQKLLIRNQIMEEQSKKNSDDGRIKEWQNQIEDINNTLAENKEKQIDVIFGQDVKSAIDDFAQAYADAWTAGDDRAKSSKDFVKNMIKQMILESIKAASSKPMEELRQRLAGFFSDGIISAWEQEQIEKDAARLMDSLDSKFAWADRFMKDEDKDEEETTREASSKGIAQASQDSVDKLDGVMTNIQGHTYSINENVRAILDSINGNATPGMPGTGKTTDLGTHTVSLADIDRNMSSMIGLGNVAVSHLSSIADNTSRLATIEQTMSSIKLGIDTMNTKGITIKR